MARESLDHIERRDNVPSQELETLDPSAAAPADGERRWALVTVGEHTVQSFPLPRRGTLVVGRGAGADIQIDAPWVSRHHVAIHVGETITAEDLGSANGTRLRDQRLARGCVVPMEAGDALELGSTLLLLQRVHGGAHAPFVRTTSFFEPRLAEECARARRYGLRFTVAALAPAAARALPLVEAALASHTRRVDIVARTPDDVRVLFVGASRSVGESTALRVLGQLAARGIEASARVVAFPDDADESGTLLSALRVAPPLHKADAEHDAFTCASPALQSVVEQAERIAATALPVAFVGEPGSGKTTLAYHMHKRSSRAAGPFLRAVAGGLSGSALAHELFGSADGMGPIGLVEASDGGTLLIDIRGGLDPHTDRLLDRFLESRCVSRGPHGEPRVVDVRVCVECDEPLDVLRDRGRLSTSLAARLSGVTLLVPPLRDRAEDVELLAQRFAERAGVTLEGDAVDALRSYPFPGNVRELRAVVERTPLVTGSTVVRRTDLQLSSLGERGLAERAGWSGAVPVPLRAPSGSHSASDPPPSGSSLKDDVERMERERILLTLRALGGNQSRAARELGISRNTLIARLKAYGVLPQRSSA